MLTTARVSILLVTMPDGTVAALWEAGDPDAPTVVGVVAQVPDEDQDGND